jgi:hypothetical protein
MRPLHQRPVWDYKPGAQRWTRWLKCNTVGRWLGKRRLIIARHHMLYGRWDAVRASHRPLLTK